MPFLIFQSVFFDLFAADLCKHDTILARTQTACGLHHQEKRKTLFSLHIPLVMHLPEPFADLTEELEGSAICLESKELEITNTLFFLFQKSNMIWTYFCLMSKSYKLMGPVSFC